MAAYLVKLPDSCPKQLANVSRLHRKEVECLRRQMNRLLLLSIAELLNMKEAAVFLTFMCLPAIMFFCIFLICIYKCIKMYVRRSIRAGKLIFFCALVSVVYKFTGF